MKSVPIFISTFLFCFCLCSACKKSDNTVVNNTHIPYAVTQSSIQDHIRFLASDSLRGRCTGSPEMQLAIQYITAQYDSAALKPADSTYLQNFTFIPRFTSQKPSEKKDKVDAYNIIGVLEGADPVLKDEYIVLGAHYDHLGTRQRDTGLVVFNGADDNASGVAVMLEAAKMLSSRRDSLKRSILFIAFDAEEHGLVGSRHFVANPVVPLKQIKLDVNLDMMGRIQTGDSLMVSGGDSFRNGFEILSMFQDTTPVCIYPIDKYLFASDHAPFFKQKIPVIYPLPKLHRDYHSPADDEELVNYDGALSMCNYTVDIISYMANQDSIVSTITNPNRESDGFYLIMSPEFKERMQFSRPKVKLK